MLTKGNEEKGEKINSLISNNCYNEKKMEIQKICMNEDSLCLLLLCLYVKKKHGIGDRKEPKTAWACVWWGESRVEVRRPHSFVHHGK